MAYPNPYGPSRAAGANYAKQYKQQQIETASPEEILIMLYEGAIRFLVIAKKALAEKDIQTFHNNLLRSQQIIVEFMSSLDMEIGGEIATNLYNLYEYLHYRLVQANLKKDDKMIDEVLDHLRKLKATWEEAIEIASKERDGARPVLAAGQPTTVVGDEEEDDYDPYESTAARSYSA